MRVSYFDSDGRFCGTGNSPDLWDLEFNRPPNCVMVEGNYSDEHYLDSDQVVRKIPKSPGPHATLDWPTKTWVTDLQKAWAIAREKRAARLAATDWTALPDVPLSEERRQQWQAYRQALRDVTDQPDPVNIVWPVPPQ